MNNEQLAACGGQRQAGRPRRPLFIIHYSLFISRRGRISRQGKEGRMSRYELLVLREEVFYLSRVDPPVDAVADEYDRRQSAGADASQAV